MSNQEIVDNKFFQGEQNIESYIEEESENDLILSKQEIVDNKFPQESIGNEKFTEIAPEAENDDTLVKDPADRIDDKSDLTSLLDYALGSDNENDDLEIGIDKNGYGCVFCGRVSKIENV